MKPVKPMILEINPKILNPVYIPFMHSETRIQIFFGGSSSGKSVFLATRCVLDALQGRNTLVTRKVGRTLRGSCWNECLKVIGRMRLGAYFSVNKSDMTITSSCNGAQILFAGLDDVEKIKSITPQTGVLTDIWMEEATEDEYSDFKQLEKRLRGVSRYPKRITISFNPVYKTHWLFTHFFVRWDEQKTLYQDSDLTILKTTYKDNRFLTPDDIYALENEQDEYYRNVYTLGNWGVLGDVIFRNWKVEDLSKLKKSADRLYYGLDFGFSSDPSALVKVHYNRKCKRLYVLEEMCERGLTNDLLAKRVQAIAGRGYVTCDSAEPKSIAELRNYGVNALATKKGKDSVLHGIQWLQQHEIIVDCSCISLRQELTTYQWKRDKDGNSLAMPEDRNNHLIDALRYALESESAIKIIRTGTREGLGI